MLENASHTSTSVLLFWGSGMMSHATCTEMCGVSMVFHFTQHFTNRGAAFAAWPQSLGTFQDVVWFWAQHQAPDPSS